ncbi:MAG: hypothetical protein RIF33_17180 [Cyclobacteriaceae bacterium]
MKHTEPLEPSSYYHIYNRGINGEVLFKDEGNYNFFLQKYDHYISPIADTYVYCLMGNHFHFLIRTKAEDKIVSFYTKSGKENNKSVSSIMSYQFAHFFNGFTQAINKQSSRTGKLLELPFRRIVVDDDSYFSRLVYYIHANPQLHGVVSSFRYYAHSSYQSHLSTQPTKLMRDEVLAWFGGRAGYEKFHQDNIDLQEITSLTLE